MRTGITLALAVALGIAASACDGGDGAEESSVTETETAITVTIPLERTSPFCEGINALNAELEDVDPADARVTIIAAYTELLPVVPPEIAADFDVVLEELRNPPPTTSTTTVPPTTVPATTGISTSTSTTTTTSTTSTTVAPSSSGPPSTFADGNTVPPSTDFWEEGYSPELTPQLRVGAYIQFACYDNANNPGPADTVPSAAVTTTEA